MLVSPIRRQGTSNSIINLAPCGGIEKRKAGMMTNRNSIINVIWEIRQPIQNGFCSVKISPGIENEKNFTLLYPLDNNIDLNNKNVNFNEGEFPCGRMKGFESKKFQLPEDYVCDKCTLQWVWRTPAGNLYSCSDMMINGQKIENCLASCLNGGACFNGKCICKDDFYGEFCEINSKFII